jgi:hypothetical protein
MVSGTHSRSIGTNPLLKQNHPNHCDDNDSGNPARRSARQAAIRRPRSPVICPPFSRSKAWHRSRTLEIRKHFLGRSVMTLLVIAGEQLGRSPSITATPFHDLELSIVMESALLWPTSVNSLLSSRLRREPLERFGSGYGGDLPIWVARSDHSRGCR